MSVTGLKTKRAGENPLPDKFFLLRNWNTTLTVRVLSWEAFRAKVEGKDAGHLILSNAPICRK